MINYCLTSGRFCAHH